MVADFFLSTSNVGFSGIHTHLSQRLEAIVSDRFHFQLYHLVRQLLFKAIALDMVNAVIAKENVRKNLTVMVGRNAFLSRIFCFNFSMEYDGVTSNEKFQIDTICEAHTC
jgi:hypothetical protein